MKTNPTSVPVRNLNENLALMLLMTILLILSFFLDGHAQGTGSFKNDPYFPARHKFSAGIITTYAGTIPPPVLIADVLYGVNDKFSVGITGGTTGAMALAGFRLNVNLLQHHNFRFLYRMTSAYYPERNGKFLFDRVDKHIMPWMLTIGMFDAEWRTRKGIRWSIGTGFLETHCIDGMMNLFSGRTPSAEEKEQELEFEIFNTIQTSVSIPLSKKFTLRPEVITVWNGVQLVKGDEHKVRPIYIYLNLVYTF